MQLASHLRRSKYGIISIRLAVPRDLQGKLARRELIRSLNIRDSVIAQHWAIALTSRYGAHFEDFWDMVRRGYDPSQFDPKDIGNWLGHQKDTSTYKVKLNILTGEAEIESDPNHPDDHRQAMEAIKTVARESKEVLENPVVAERLRLAKERDDAERAALWSESMAGMQAGIQAQTAAIVQQAVLIAQPKAAPQAESIPLSEGVALYERSLQGMKKETIDDYMYAIRWFERSVGPQTPIATITREMVVQWKSELIEHYTGIRNKKQEKRVAKGHVRADPIAGLPQAEAKAGSVDKIIGRVHRFMLACQKQKYFPRDEDLPTTGLFLKSHAERKNESFYERFDHQELKAIFAPENLLATKMPHERWIPLLSLLTGARIGELSQIYLKDIYQEADGCWVISIQDKQAFQRIKTNAGRRVVPIHPQLIALGFLDYVADVKAAVPESDRLFPYLRYDKHNGFGDVPSEAFARYLDKLHIFAEQKVHHSFRKTANQRLKENGVEVSIRSQLVGHEKEGVNEVIYAEDVPVATLYELLKHRLVFPEVDFTPLKYVPGSFVEVLKSEMIAAIKRKRNKGDGEANSNQPVPLPAAPPSEGATVTVSVTAQAPSPRSQKMQNHLAAKAAREARAMPKKRGRPRKSATTA